MASEVYDVRLLFAQAIQEIFGSCRWPMVNLDKVPIYCLLYGLAHLANLDVNPKIGIRIRI